MVNTMYNSTQQMIDKLQSLKRKTELKFIKNLLNVMMKSIIQDQVETFNLKKMYLVKVLKV